MDLKESIAKLRRRILSNEIESREEWPIEAEQGFLDEFIDDPGHSDLEKAVFLMLHQSPSSAFDYVVVPNERIFIPDIYSMTAPRIEYEIDFAIYGGSANEPLKVAVECDGLRSHGQRHAKRDRRKDINLQANGWMVVRYTSREIHEELAKFNDPDHIYCDLLGGLENVLSERLNVISRNRFSRFHAQLAGWTWGVVVCTNCGNSFHGRLNRRKHQCKKCGVSFLRVVGDSEDVWFEGNGYVFFKER
jgi:hypothetical protein